MQLRKRYMEIVKSHGRIVGTILFFFILFHKTMERCYIYFIKKFVPVDKSILVFRSMPDYSDNSRALTEYMVNNGYTNKYSIYFDVKDSDKYRNREESITFISIKSKYGNYKFKYIRLLYTAGYLMSTHEMILGRPIARKEQYLVRLWHGCSFKDRSSFDGKRKRVFDVALVPGPLFVKTKAYFWDVDEKYILPIGYPRYDWLRKIDPSAQALKESFKRNHDTKVVLWMPTFRIDKGGKYTESNNITQFPLMKDNCKWIDLDRTCIDKNIVLIVKLHPFQMEYKIPFDSFSNIKQIDNQVFDESDIPMYKFIALTDALITDYSSIAVDYLIVNRPIAYTLDDFEEYKNTRGFVFDDPRIYMPGHHLYTFEDLKGFLSDISEGEDPYLKNRQQIFGKVISESECYCSRILYQLGITK